MQNVKCTLAPSVCSAASDVGCAPLVPFLSLTEEISLFQFRFVCAANNGQERPMRVCAPFPALAQLVPNALFAHLRSYSLHSPTMRIMFHALD